MARATNSQRETELQELRDWCIAMIQFMGQSDPSDLFVKFEKIIDETFQDRDLRGLRAVKRDMREWAAGLSPDRHQKLDKLLRERFGRGLVEESKEFHKEVKRILKRGKIKTPDEYRLLTSYMDQIYADDSKRAEAAKVDQLLATFKPSGPESGE